MGQLLEDRGGPLLTSVDFGVAVDKRAPAPHLPIAPATSMIVAPEQTLDAVVVIAAARREKRAPGWIVRSLVQRTCRTVGRWMRRFLGVATRTKDRMVAPEPTASERADSARTVIGPAARADSQWNVATKIVREKTFRGSLTHDLELDD